MNLLDILVIISLIVSISLFINIILNQNNTEHLTSLSNEAIQNLSSAYNTNSLSVSNLQVTQAFNLLPRGIIVAWYYGIVPPGWVMCDGNNGTPDLRSRFVIGSGQGAGLSNRQIGSSGGEENHTLTINEMPSHNHTLIQNLGANGSGPEQIQAWFGNGGTQILTNNAGGGAPHNNMPPWYALMYIMKS